MTTLPEDSPRGPQSSVRPHLRHHVEGAICGSDVSPHFIRPLVGCGSTRSVHKSLVQRLKCSLPSGDLLQRGMGTPSDLSFTICSPRVVQAFIWAGNISPYQTSFMVPYLVVFILLRSHICGVALSSLGTEPPSKQRPFLAGRGGGFLGSYRPATIYPAGYIIYVWSAA